MIIRLKKYIHLIQKKVITKSRKTRFCIQKKGQPTTGAPDPLTGTMSRAVGAVGGHNAKLLLS
jgi:hypothetical protein